MNESNNTAFEIKTEVKADLTTLFSNLPSEYGLLLVLFLTLSVVLIILVWRSKSEKVRNASLIAFVMTVVIGVLVFMGLWGYGKFKEIQTKNPDPSVKTSPEPVVPKNPDTVPEPATPKNPDIVPQSVSGLVRIDGTTTPVDGVTLTINLVGVGFSIKSGADGTYEFSDLKGEKNQSVRIYLEKEGFKLSGGGKSISTNLGKIDVPIYLIEVGK